jgi:hypothetical protein
LPLAEIKLCRSELRNQNICDFASFTVDYFFRNLYYYKTRRGVEQLAARRAHNPEAAGSSPAPAKDETSVFGLKFFLF